MVKLSDLLDASLFEGSVANGLIDTRSHPLDPQLRVFSYSKRVQFEGLWTPDTRLARGLMLQFDETDSYETARVVGRGIPKFFTVEQMDSDWSRAKLIDDDENVTVDEAPEISWDAPAHVANKLNGALGLAYLDPEGGVSVATKGSFGSLEATVGTRLMHEALASAELRKKFVETFLVGATPLFEIITPERPHPINYGDMEALVYLGSVAHETGVFTPATDSSPATAFGFSLAETLPHRTLKEAVTAPYVPNTEGMVVVIGSDSEQELYKVKPAEYHELRRLFYSVAPKDHLKFVMGLKGEEIASMGAPEDVSLGEADSFLKAAGGAHILKRHQRVIYEDFIAPAQTLALEAQKETVRIASSLGDEAGRGAFAAEAKASAVDMKLLFAAYDDLTTGGGRVFEVARSAVARS